MLLTSEFMSVLLYITLMLCVHIIGFISFSSMQMLYIIPIPFLLMFICVVFFLCFTIHYNNYK